MATTAKKSAHEWLQEPEVIASMLVPGGSIVEIADYDGWRENDGVTLGTPITLEDFWERIGRSTIIERG